jgi:hypothetical protein
MSISNYAENKILDHLAGVTTWTKPTNVYIQLHTADPGENGTENAAGYSARQLSSWNAAANGSISLSSSIDWPNVNTTETYTHWSVWDAEVSGNCLWTGALTANVAIVSGESFQITSLTLSID